MSITWRHFAAVYLALVCSISLNGCSMDVPKHKFGFWQGKNNYLTKFQYYYEGLPAKKAILNSCSDPLIPPAMVCGGHGRCRSWNELLPGQSPGTTGKLVAFCECNKHWADPECRTERRSQATAYVISLFGGVFGLDQFYLGFTTYGWTKLLSFGGLGLWWVFDVVRIGSYPVSTNGHFRLAADLPHYAFACSAFSVMLALGFSLGIWAINAERKKKAHELILMRKDEEDVVEEVFDVMKKKRSAEANARENPVQQSQSELSRLPTEVPKGQFSGYGSTVQPPASQPGPPTSQVDIDLPPPGTVSTMSIGSPYGSSATLPPASIATLSRSFRPAQTLPPQTLGSLPSQTLPPQTLPSRMVSGSVPSQTLLPQVAQMSPPQSTQTLPPAPMASGMIGTSNSVLTEYSLPRAVQTQYGAPQEMTNSINSINMTGSIGALPEAN